MDEITRWPRKSEISRIADIKSAGVEIDPTSRGIIFSLLGLPGGAKIQKIRKIQKNPKNPVWGLRWSHGDVFSFPKQPPVVGFLTAK